MFLIHDRRPARVASLLAFLFLIVPGVIVPGVALADTGGHSEQHVYVLVDANVLVRGEDVTVNLGRIGTGEVCGDLRWRVDANQQQVRFSIGVSDLWKGTDPFQPGSRPIKVVRNKGGVYMDVDAGGPIRGQDRWAAFTGLGTLEGFPIFVTESVTFESSQNGRFSQGLTTRICWNQDDPEKARGQYGGLVYLWVVVVPKLR